MLQTLIEKKEFDVKLYQKNLNDFFGNENSEYQKALTVRKEYMGKK